MSLIKIFDEQGTLLDGELNGSKPKAALNNTSKPFINNTFSKGEYLNNLPGDIDVQDEINRAKDITG